MLLFFKIHYSVIFMARTDQQFPLRLPPELKEKLENACKESGRSKNAEAVYRLEQSFEHDQKLPEILQEQTLNALNNLDNWKQSLQLIMQLQEQLNEQTKMIKELTEKSQKNS